MRTEADGYTAGHGDSRARRRVRIQMGRRARRYCQIGAYPAASLARALASGRSVRCAGSRVAAIELYALEQALGLLSPAGALTLSSMCRLCVKR